MVKLMGGMVDRAILYTTPEKDAQGRTIIHGWHWFLYGLFIFIVLSAIVAYIIYVIKWRRDKKGKK